MLPGNGSRMNLPGLFGIRARRVWIVNLDQSAGTGVQPRKIAYALRRGR